MIRSHHIDAANYVKVQGDELPVRWSAIEVLKENKYTKASDVWSYGVLIFEVMSRGAEPYSECASLGEVATRIKDGYETSACLQVCVSKATVVHQHGIVYFGRLHRAVMLAESYKHCAFAQKPCSCYVNLFRKCILFVYGFL